MRNSSWLAITLAVSAVAPITVTTLTIVQPAWAQIVRNDDVAGIMSRARTQLEPIRRRLAQAERTGRTEERTAALADMKRIIDEVAPVVESMSGDVEMQRAVHREFDAWQAEYASANEAGSADVGDFFLFMSNRWKELSAPVQAYADETKPATFEQMVQDSSIEGFGMPKTLAAKRALDTYLIEIQSHPNFAKNKNNPNVAQDIAQAQKSRAEVTAKLAEAARAVVDQAAVADLNDDGRSRVRTMLEHDIPYALAGSPQTEEIQARARGLLMKGQNNNEQPNGGFEAHGVLTEIADKVWPIYAGRYSVRSGEPMATGRGTLVEFRDAQVVPPEQLGQATDADLVLLVEGRPVVCIFDPVVKQHVTNILGDAGMKAIAGEKVTVIGMVRGLGRVNFVRQPGSTPATTNPAGQEGESSPQNAATLQPRDGVAIDVLALHAGPLAIGVDPTPDQEERTTGSVPAGARQTGAGQTNGGR